MCSRDYPERRRYSNISPEKKYIAIFNHAIAFFNHGGIDTGNAHSRARERERGKIGKPAAPTPSPSLHFNIDPNTLLTPPHLRSHIHFVPQIAVLPPYSHSDAFLVPDDKSIVPNVRSAPMPLLVRLARFYGGMFPWVVGFRSCKGWNPRLV